MDHQTYLVMFAPWGSPVSSMAKGGWHVISICAVSCCLLLDALHWHCIAVQCSVSVCFHLHVAVCFPRRVYSLISAVNKIKIYTKICLLTGTVVDLDSASKYIHIGFGIVIDCEMSGAPNSRPVIHQHHAALYCKINQICFVCSNERAPQRRPLRPRLP